ncbi:unnamed protein product [Ectocarpus sp. 4 AP-2014]
MWLDAIDLALSRLAALSASTPPLGNKEPACPAKETETLQQGEPGRVTTWGRSVLARVRAVSVSGQQHGTVFWKAGAAERLKGLGGLGPKDTLVEALSGCFARRDCPIWADSSTTRECHNLEEALGGPKAVAEATGSAAYCRFSGNQISRIARREPKAYASCERVSLVSSFVTSLLVGRYCSIDASDASGMNLMDISSRDWHEGALAAAKAEGLREKLGRVCPSYECQGKVSPFFSTKFGLNPDCVVIAGSGDNPCGLAGLGLSGEGTVAVSLGTSDTIMGITSQPSPQEEGHIMVNPVEESSCFAMLVYKNGALSRERVRDELCSGSWGELDKILASTSPGNGGHIGLFVDMPEITPQIATTGRFRRGPEDEVVDEAFPAGVEARAVVEGRFLSMRGRMQRMGIPRATAVLATGGGTNSPAMMQVLADVFSAPVFLRTVPDAAAIGAALRAKHGYLCSVFSGEEKWRNCTPPGTTTGGLSGLVESTASAGVGVGGSGAAAFVPFSRVLPGDETVGTNGAVEPATGATAGGGQGVKSSGKVVMRLAATPRGDAEALYKGMAER